MGGLVADWQVEAAQRLLEGFSGFKRLHWNHSPIAGLKPSEVWALITIKKKTETGAPGIRISDIGKMLRVATPTATQLINSLETAGYVERTRDEKDRRVVHINLTSAGEKVIKTARKKLHGVFENLAVYLGEEDSLKLAELMTRVYEYFTTVDLTGKDS